MNRGVYLILAFGLIGVSFGAPLARYVPELAALTIAFWRMTGASLLLWSHGGVQRQGALERSVILPIVVAGIFLGLHFGFFYSAVKLAPIANATLFATMAPFFTLIYERFVLHRHLSRVALSGLLLAIAGAVIIQGTGLKLDPEASLGNLLALASSLVMSVVLILAERIRASTSNVLYTRWVYMVAAITLGVIILFSGTDISFRTPDIKWLLGLAILPTLIGHNSMSYAVKFIRPTIVGAMPFGEPVLASILAWILFGETVSWYVALGGGLTLTGLVVMTLNRSAAKISVV
jgi:drug/metabolite transporter (DMT)-like permease